ncbi:sigma-70 family RNA polymerase sigma factor [soil metagenome]
MLTLAPLPKVAPWRKAARVVQVTLDVLLGRCAAGDESAFAELYDQVVDSVYGLARAVVRDPSMAEEIAHDVLLEVWDKASRFDPERGRAKAWIATITRRRAIDVVRSEQAGRNRETRVATSSPPPPTDPVGDHVVDLVEHKLVRQGLEGLTELQRQAIDLAYFGGLTYRQVAQHLDVPLGTIKTRMRDGLKRLAGTFGGEHE